MAMHRAHYLLIVLKAKTMLRIMTVNSEKVAGAKAHIDHAVENNGLEYHPALLS